LPSRPGNSPTLPVGSSIFLPKRLPSPSIIHPKILTFRLPGTKKAASEYGPSASAAAAANEDDIDLFGSDDEDPELEKAKAERLAAYQAKKAAKGPGPIAKSSVVLDVKPWDDETDLAAMEKSVRSIELDGLLWGASKLVPIGYGIKKLQISCVIEDDKVGLDLINDSISELDDLVQSVDVVSFNKV
jgi:elongation factor 1-beta